jgi:hypothetical protein
MDNDSLLRLKMATITVGTSQGPSKIYARSRSSIHQHAMRVSLRRAGMRSSSDVAQPAQASSAPQPRQELMGRFRAKENLGKRREKHGILVSSKRATTPTEKPDEDSPISVRSIFPLNRRNPFHHFPFETSSDTVYLHSLRSSLRVSPVSDVNANTRSGKFSVRSSSLRY